MMSQHVEEDGCEVLERWQTLDKKIVQRECFLVWHIWCEINKFMFENQSAPFVVLHQRVTRQVEEFNYYTSRI